jgi:hypothetical protein
MGAPATRVVLLSANSILTTHIAERDYSVAGLFVTDGAVHVYVFPVAPTVLC